MGGSEVEVAFFGQIRAVWPDLWIKTPIYRGPHRAVAAIGVAAVAGKALGGLGMK
jgi:hypothetical protein